MSADRGATQSARNASAPRRLYYYNSGFFTQSRVRRILELSGFDLRLGKAGPEDLIAVWGKRPSAERGRSVGDKTGAALLHVEDAFLRSVKPGTSGAPPLGLTLDHQRPYFDAAGPSDLEQLLASHPFDDSVLLQRARDAIAWMRHAQISKYNDFPLGGDMPEPGYILVIDQTRDDASIRYGGADANRFREMLVFAQQEHLGRPILIKTHPAAAGYFSAADESEEIRLFRDPVAPQALLEGAVAVYTVTSNFGFEAILAGHKPVVFGQPFYAGWGLSDDRQPIDRRQRKLTRNQLFAGAMMLYPRWYDPYRDRLCEIEDVLASLEALARATREDAAGYSAPGMRLWKRPHLRRFFGPGLRFGKTAAPGLTWGRDPDSTFRIEDGFLRSRGLGAELIPPVSLIRDASGMYYDATRASDLEHLITGATRLPDYAVARAARLRERITREGVTKYNLAGPLPDLPKTRPRLLVPGQVADDASLRFGAAQFADMEGLLDRVRADFPQATLIYKPHPDVVAGLRPGLKRSARADINLDGGDMAALLGQVDHVATLTSLTGFEALIRGLPVTTYAVPFYAGWGLSDDRAEMPARRQARPSLDQFLYACLIAYPRYLDPKSGQAAPVEYAVELLARGDIPHPGRRNRLLAKLQGVFASQSWLWRG